MDIALEIVEELASLLQKVDLEKYSPALFAEERQDMLMASSPDALRLHTLLLKVLSTPQFPLKKMVKWYTASLRKKELFLNPHQVTELVHFSTLLTQQCLKQRYSNPTTSSADVEVSLSSSSDLFKDTFKQLQSLMNELLLHSSKDLFLQNFNRNSGIAAHEIIFSWMSEYSRQRTLPYWEKALQWVQNNGKKEFLEVKDRLDFLALYNKLEKKMAKYETSGQDNQIKPSVKRKRVEAESASSANSIGSTTLSTKKLLIFDLNGVLIAKTANNHQIIIRPCALDFLTDLSRYYILAIWSSARKTTIRRIMKLLLAEDSKKSFSFLFIWGQEQCILRHVEDGIGHENVLFMKPLQRVWETFALFDNTNTVVLTLGVLKLNVF